MSVDDLFNLGKDHKKIDFEPTLLDKLADGLFEQFGAWGTGLPVEVTPLQCEIIPFDDFTGELKVALEKMFKPSSYYVSPVFYKGLEDYYYTRGIIPAYMEGEYPRNEDELSSAPMGKFTDCLIRSKDKHVLEVICEYSRYIVLDKLEILTDIRDEDKEVTQ